MIIVGDVHVKKQPESPYNKGLLKLLQYIFETYQDRILIFTGDLLDEQLIHNAVKQVFQSLFRNHEKDIYVVTGNHELKRYYELGNVLLPLHGVGNTHVIDRREDLQIEGHHVRFLPYLPLLSAMKNYELITEPCDVAVTHFAYPGTNRDSPDEIKVNFKTTIATFYGHIHEQFLYEDEFGTHIGVGVPAPTRNGEETIAHRVIDVGAETWTSVALPKLFTIETIDFGQEPSSRDNVINIRNAPSRQMIAERYPESQYNLRDGGVELLVESSESDAELREKVDAMVTGEIPDKFIAWARGEDVPLAYVSCVVDALQQAASSDHAS